MTGSVLLIGLGDLGRRVAAGIAGSPGLSQLILAGRGTGDGRRFAALVAACSVSRVRFCELDASRLAEIERLLRRERPDVVVHCASALSPWHVQSRRDPVAAAVAAGGFAVQLPAQLSLLFNVMRAVRTVGLPAAVINASYPDLTHPVLSAAGLAPTVGFGNVGMILFRVRANLLARLDRDVVDEPVRVIAHHAHVTPAMVGGQADGGPPAPRVYVGADWRREDALSFAGPPLASEPGLNALSAASGLPIVRAFLGHAPALQTSAPGPSGLPGGFPILIERGNVVLDLPPGTDLREAIDFQLRCARWDGVERIEPAGTVVFTEAAQAAVRSCDPELAEPLALSDVDGRLRRLLSALGLG